MPEPEGPMMAVKVPRSKARLTPSSARTLPSPGPKVRVRFSSWRETSSLQSSQRAAAAVSGAWPSHAGRYGERDLRAIPPNVTGQAL